MNNVLDDVNNYNKNRDKKVLILNTIKTLNE